MKQECISTITREQKDIVSKADVFARRITELEGERDQLADKLKQRHERDESVTKEAHDKYQNKLRRVQVLDSVAALLTPVICSPCSANLIASYACVVYCLLAPPGRN